MVLVPFFRIFYCILCCSLFPSFEMNKEKKTGCYLPLVAYHGGFWFF